MNIQELLKLAFEFNLPAVVRNDHIVICGEKEFIVFNCLEKQCFYTQEESTLK